MSHHPESCSCYEHSKPSSLDQNLGELDFERSIVGAASRNDIAAVTRHLANGTHASLPSATGYTALVRTQHCGVPQNRMGWLHVCMCVGVDVDVCGWLGV